MTDRFEDHSCLRDIERLAITTRDQGVNPDIYNLQIEEACRNCTACYPAKAARP